MSFVPKPNIGRMARRLVEEVIEQKIVADDLSPSDIGRLGGDFADILLEPEGFEACFDVNKVADAILRGLQDRDYKFGTLAIASLREDITAILRDELGEE